MTTEYIAYVGTYTRATSMGIYGFRHHADTGTLTPVGRVADAVSPSFLTFHPSGQYLYSVNETSMLSKQPGGGVSSFSIDHSTGQLTPINRVSSHGADPCHLTCDRTGRWLFVANYTGGSIGVFPLAEDGSLGEATQVVQHEGCSGVNPVRQEAPHVHSVDISPDNQFLYVDDLGLDQILIYAFNAAAGQLTLHHVTKTLPGAGPRHIAFSPDRKYVYGVNELFASVTAYHHDQAKAELEAFQAVSTLPGDYDGLKWASEIAVHPSGKFLWVSNRAHDSIASYRISPTDGRLTVCGHTPTQGVRPRHFTISPHGHFLHVSNSSSDNVVTFQIDEGSGTLAPTGQVVQVPEPACILFTALTPA